MEFVKNLLQLVSFKYPPWEILISLSAFSAYIHKMYPEYIYRNCKF